MSYQWGGCKHKTTLFVQYLFSACLSGEQGLLTSFHLNKQQGKQMKTTSCMCQK